MVMWSSEISLKFEMIEIFAGLGRVSGQFKRNGLSTVAFDRDYAEQMDFMTEGGMA